MKNRKRLRSRKPIRQVSDKQAIELRLRAQLKRDLIDEFGDVCMTCNNVNRDWRGISLAHIIPLSRLGKTTRENCLLECYICHDRYEKHPERRPLWQRIKYGITQ